MVRKSKKSTKWERKVARVARKSALQISETKFSGQTRENNNLNHNSTLYQGNLLKTTQGTQNPSGYNEANANRLGDKINAKGLKLKFWMANKVDRPNVMYKMYVFRYKTDQSLADSNFWRGLNGNGATMNRMIDSVNQDKVKLLHSFNFNSLPADYSINEDEREKAQYHSVWVDLKGKTIQYNADESQFPLFTDIGFAIVAYDAFTTLQSDSIASVAWSSMLYFKDP